MRKIDARRRQDRQEKAPVEFDLAYTVKGRHECGESCPQRCSKQFDYVDHDDHFVCHGDISTLALSELAHNSDIDTATAEGIAIIRDVFSDAFGDESEYRRFFRAARHIDDDQLLEILEGLVEEFAARPTVQPSSSQPQPERTTNDSAVRLLPGGYPVASTA